MIKILIGVAIIGAFYSLLGHIVSKREKEDLVNNTINGALRMVAKILIPIIVFLMAVIGLLYITGWIDYVL